MLKKFSRSLLCSPKNSPPKKLIENPEKFFRPKVVFAPSVKSRNRILRKRVKHVSMSLENYNSHNNSFSQEDFTLNDTYIETQKGFALFLDTMVVFDKIIQGYLKEKVKSKPTELLINPKMDVESNKRTKNITTLIDNIINSIDDIKGLLDQNF